MWKVRVVDTVRTQRYRHGVKSTTACSSLPDYRSSLNSKARPSIVQSARMPNDSGSSGSIAAPIPRSRGLHGQRRGWQSLAKVSHFPILGPSKLPSSSR